MLLLACQNVLHLVIKEGALDNAMSLAARVNGGPTEVVTTLLRFHTFFDKSPNLPFHDWYRILTRNEEQFFILIDPNILIEKLSCREEYIISDDSV